MVDSEMLMSEQLGLQKATLPEAINNVYSTYTAFLHIASVVTDMQPAGHKRGKRIIGFIIWCAISCGGKCLYRQYKHSNF